MIAPRIVAGVVFSAMLAAAHGANAPVVLEKYPSPDAAWQLEVLGFDRDPATEWRISLRRHGKFLHRRVLKPELDVRDVEMSWAPSSRAVLIGENRKAGMDLTVLRIRKRGVTSAHFGVGELVDKKVEREMAWREDLKNVAPVARVTWSTVKWDSPSRCRMTYIFTGLGHQGETELRVDFTDAEPALQIGRLHPLTHPEYFKQD